MSGLSPYITPGEAARLGGPVRRRLIWWGRRMGQRLADLGAPAVLLGHRHVPHVLAKSVARVETVHAMRHHAAPLPWTVADRAALDDDPGWWGFAMRDVPDRAVAPVEILQLGPARVLAGQTPDRARDFSPAILDARGRSLDLREIRYRPFHANLARRAPDLSLDRAIWVAERVFDNHSHWLSAHLPKLVMLRDSGLLDSGDLVLPAARPDSVDASLRSIGIDPAVCHQLPVGHVLRTGTLTLVACDRFHPDLLKTARAALVPPGMPRTGPILISREEARGRRLIGEADLLSRHDLRPVRMETLDFAQQVRTMAGATAVVAPHGAGLTNMLFCRPGTPIIEIADPDYPNPNFYAMAAALDLPYAYVPARGSGGGHPLHRNLEVAPDALAEALANVQDHLS